MLADCCKIISRSTFLTNQVTDQEMPPALLPQRDAIDWGTDPSRTTKSFTIRVRSLESQIEDEAYGGNTIKTTQPVFIDLYVRDVTAAGRRQGREPEILVAIEKYLVEFMALHRLQLQELLGIQYAEITATQTFSEIEGGEEYPSPWYHCIIRVNLHYWLRCSEESTLEP